MTTKRTSKKTAPPVQKTITEDEIRLRSYLIWEREGRPHGRDKLHWQMAIAELIVEQENSFKAGAKPASRPRKPAGRKGAAATARSTASNGTIVH